MVHMSSGGETSGSSRIPVRVSSAALEGAAGRHTSLVAAVSQVGVHAPRLSLGGCDGNAVLGGIVEEILPALEAVAELGQPPGCDDLDGRLESVECKLKADLVITLAGTAVGNEVAALLLGNSDLCASDDWTSQTGTQEVATLVRGVALNSAEAELLNELFLEIEDDHLQRTDLEGLLLDLLPRLLLADVGEEAHNLIALLYTQMSAFDEQLIVDARVPMSHWRMVDVSRPPVSQISSCAP